MSDGSLKEVKTMENSETVVLKNGCGRLREEFVARASNFKGLSGNILVFWIIANGR